MRRRQALRESRLMRVAAGASMLVIPATTAALADAPKRALATASQSATPPDPSIRATLKSRRIRFGRDVIATGRLSASSAGQTVALQFHPAGGSGWHQVSSATVRRDGRFRLAAPLYRSGMVRVLGGQQPGSAQQPSSSPALPLASDSSGGAAATSAGSAPQHIAVQAAIHLGPRTFAMTGARAIEIRGHLLPRGVGRRVRLVGRDGGRWHTLAIATTGSRGGFKLRYTPPGTGLEQLAVAFAGDRTNAAVSAQAGSVTVYRQSVASWYDDGGSTACGFHAYYGVANRSLPCGTRVRFMSGGRAVTAVVDDRGPFVSGREWDLNQNTAAALGFSGVGAVWSSS